jgi:hypothetical protein
MIYSVAMLLRFGAVFIFSSLTSLVSAQSPVPCTSSLPVNVLDQDEAPRTDLTSNSFQVRSGRSEIKVSNADYSVKARRVVLVLNLSSSVTGRAREFIHAAAAAFISLSSSRIPIALVVFSGSGVQRFDFQTQWPKLEEELRGAMESSDVGKGRATTYDAIMAASQLISSAEPGDAIYVISNLKDSSSKSSPGAIREVLIRQHSRLYVLAVTGNEYPGDEGFIINRNMQDLVHSSGGFLLFEVLSDNLPANQDWTPQELQTRTAFLIDLVAGFYTLKLERPAQIRKTFGIKISVHGRSAGNLSKIIFPETFACD